MISGFRRDVNENCALLGCLQQVVIMPYRRLGTACQSHFGFLIPQDGTDMLPQYVGKELPLLAA